MTNDNALGAPSGSTEAQCRRCGMVYTDGTVMCDDPSAPGAGSFGVCGGTVAAPSEGQSPLMTAVKKALNACEVKPVAAPLATEAPAANQRPIKQLRDTVAMLAHFIWHKRTRPGEHMWTIPVDKERDWDCILSDAIDELEQLRAAHSQPSAAPAGAPAPTERQSVIAERIARAAHAGQSDTVTGAPYITHVERVVAMVEGDDAKAVAWLHDVLEDCDEWNSGDLCRAGISDDVREAVERLTRGAEPYAEYIDTIRLCGPDLARTVKVADLRDHLQPNCPARLRPRYERALAALSPAAPVLPAPTDDVAADLAAWTQWNAKGGPSAPTERTIEWDALHTGDDEHVDLLSGVLAAIEEAISDHEDMGEDVDALKDAFSDLERFNAHYIALRRTAVPPVGPPARLQELLEKWIPENRLQSYEDRERFRAEARALLSSSAGAAKNTTTKT